MASPLSVDLVNNRMERLARALAWDIYPLHDLLKNQGVTFTEYDVWSKTPRFKTLLASHLADWAAASNVGQRIAVKAGVIAEEALPGLSDAINDQKNALNHRITAFQAMCELAGLMTDGAKSNGAAGISITFNLGGPDTLKVTTEGPIVDAPALPDESQEEDEFGGLNELLLAAAAE